MLTDLDELMLTIRDQESRRYMEEALVCFRSRAYRAAIVAVYVAVVYDIFGKIRILKAEAEPAAVKHIEKLDNAIVGGNRDELMAIEKRLLEDARDTFQFINILEYEDFSKLRDDRHRCAHPAFISDTLLFNPSPEAVRAHIVHAVNHLLAQPPVNGKAAIEKAVRDIASLSFPKTQAGVEKLMNSKYLDRPRTTFPASLVSVLVKALIRRDVPELLGHEQACFMALEAISRRHPHAYERRMQETLKRLVESDTDSIVNLFPVLQAEPRAWGWLDEATRIQVTSLAENYVFGSGRDEAILDALAVRPLRETVLKGLRSLEDDERFALIASNPRADLLDDAIELFETSLHFRDAEPRGRFVLNAMGHLLSEDQIRRCLKAVPSNYEIYAARDAQQILRNFLASPKGASSLQKLRSDWQEMIISLFATFAESTPRKPFAGLVEDLEKVGLGPFDWESVRAAAEAKQAADIAEWKAKFEDEDG